MILHYPQDALDKIEEISYLLKHKQEKPIQKWLLVEEFWNFKKSCANKADFIEKSRKYFELPQPEEEGQEAPEQPAVNQVPDLLS